MKPDPTDIIEKILIDYAKNRKTITYGELTRKTNGLRPQRFWHSLLMKLSTLSKEKYNFDISILVVSKVTGIPGKGFGQSLTMQEFKDWQTKPQEFFDLKTKEIFDYFSYNHINNKPVIEGHEEIDFLL